MTTIPQANAITFCAQMPSRPAITAAQIAFFTDQAITALGLWARRAAAPPQVGELLAALGLLSEALQSEAGVYALTEELPALLDLITAVGGTFPCEPEPFC